MTTFFLDTGYIITLETADDQNHKAASIHWESLITSLPPLVTTSYILDEVVTFFNSRNQHNKAIEVGDSLMRSPSVQFVHVDKSLFHEGWQYFKQHKDKSYSLTDCISFILIKQLKIQAAFTFDKHFSQAGFKMLPQ